MDATLHMEASKSSTNVDESANEAVSKQKQNTHGMFQFFAYHMCSFKLCLHNTYTCPIC